MRTPDMKVPLENLLTAVREELKPVQYGRVEPGQPPESSIPPSGVGLRFTPRVKPAVALRDWLHGQLKNANKLELLERYLARDYAVAIHWPTLLRQAFAESPVSARYALAAQRVLRVLSPYFRRELPQLDAYLREYKHRELAQEYREAGAFHVEVLLASSLGRRLVRGLVSLTEPLCDRDATNKFSRCNNCLERAAEHQKYGMPIVNDAEAELRCLMCAARKNMAKYTSVLSVDLVSIGNDGLRFTPSITTALGRVKPELNVPKAADDIRWILAARSDFEGAWRNKQFIEVNWETLGRRRVESLGSFDLAVTDDSALAAGREMRLRVMALAPKFSAVSDAETARYGYDENRTVFYAKRLSAMLGSLLTGESAARRKQLALARLAGASRPRKHKVIRLGYEGPQGTDEVSIRRHGPRWCIQIPMYLPVGVPLPRRIRLQKRMNSDLMEELYRVDFWWYSDDLEEFRRNCAAKGFEREAVEVQNVLNWFESKVDMFLRDPKTFKDALLDARANERVTELMHGERVKLGRMAPSEVKLLQDFCDTRTFEDCGRPFRGPFTQLEWARLSDLLPYRSRETLLKKVLELGFEYAKEHGWVAFLKSGYGVSKSASRRAAWLAKGVKV